MIQNNKLEVVSIRLVKEAPLYSSMPISGPEDVIKLMATELAQYDREVMCILNNNSCGQVINMNITSIGTINTAIVNPREIFKSAILSNAASIILLHNHPSGTIVPSTEDIELTRRLVRCGELMGIPVLDNIIVGGINERTFSFRANGMMPDRIESLEGEQEVIRKKAIHCR